MNNEVRQYKINFHMISGEIISHPMTREAKWIDLVQDSMDKGETFAVIYEEKNEMVVLNPHHILKIVCSW